jgi:hypothetical protein
MTLQINRAPVLTLWATIVAERLGHPADTALTLGKSVAGSAARVKARNIGFEDRTSDRDADTPRLARSPATTPVLLLGKTIQLLPNPDGELFAADGDKPADPAGVRRYLTKAFGDHLPAIRAAMEELANRHEPRELNRIGFRLYERFRPEVPPGAEGWGSKAVLQIEKILAAGRLRNAHPSIENVSDRPPTAELAAKNGSIAISTSAPAKEWPG